VSRSIFIYLPNHVKHFPETPAFIRVCGGILFFIYFWISHCLHQTVIDYKSLCRVNTQLFTRKHLIVYTNSQAIEKKHLTKAPCKHFVNNRKHSPTLRILSQNTLLGRAFALNSLFFKVFMQRNLVV
jgi:hypothetical protein